MCMTMLRIALAAGLFAPTFAGAGGRQDKTPPSQTETATQESALARPAPGALDEPTSASAASVDADGEPAPRAIEWRHMTARDRKSIEQFVEKYFPDVWKEISPLKDSDSKSYNARMERLAREMLPLMEQQQENEGRGDILIREKQLEFRIQELVTEYLNNDDPQRRDRVRRKLGDLVGKQFDAAQERRRLDVQRLEERILALKRLIEEKSQNRDAIITRQIDIRLNPSAKPEPPSSPAPPSVNQHP